MFVAFTLFGSMPLLGFVLTALLSEGSPYSFRKAPRTTQPHAHTTRPLSHTHDGHTHVERRTPYPAYSFRARALHPALCAQILTVRPNRPPQPSAPTVRPNRPPQPSTPTVRPNRPLQPSTRLAEISILITAVTLFALGTVKTTFGFGVRRAAAAPRSAARRRAPPHANATQARRHARDAAHRPG